MVKLIPGSGVLKNRWMGSLFPGSPRETEKQISNNHQHSRNSLFYLSSDSIGMGNGDITTTNDHLLDRGPTKSTKHVGECPAAQTKPSGLHPFLGFSTNSVLTTKTIPEIWQCKKTHPSTCRGRCGQTATARHTGGAGAGTQTCAAGAAARS